MGFIQNVKYMYSSCTSYIEMKYILWTNQSKIQQKSIKFASQKNTHIHVYKYS